MARARDENAFAPDTPRASRRARAAPPQRVDAVPGARRQREPAGRRGCDDIGLVVDVQQPRVRRSTVLQPRCDVRFGRVVVRARLRASGRAGTAPRRRARSRPSCARCRCCSTSSDCRAVAQPGGVDHVQRHAFDLDRLAHLVARRARDRRDDRELGAGQRVQQRALADVRLARQHDRDAFAQQRALARAVEHRFDAFDDRVELPARVGPLQEIDLFIGEVERRFDQRAQLDERIACSARSRARTRPAANGWPSAPPLRCSRRSGR